MGKKLTLHDIREAKGKRQFSEIYTEDRDEAQACEAGGIEMLVTGEPHAARIRAAAPNAFLTVGIGINDPTITNESQAIAAGFRCLGLGGDAVYAGLSIHLVAAMARESIPVVGHVGYIPYRSSWVGGPRAMGKTADEAMRLYERTRAYEDAGAVAVEMEIVPEDIATEISKRVNLMVISMGSGSGCDAQYLFAKDVIGTNTGHVPRHAEQFIDLKPELERVQKMRVEGFKAFHDAVNDGSYPAEKHNLKIKSDELQSFLKQIDGD
jgi:3-methyl-2-oxobutanoate hydroxymethyltransferase